MIFSLKFFGVANVIFRPRKVNPKAVLKKLGKFIFRRLRYREIRIPHSVKFYPEKDNWRKTASNNAAAENIFRAK
jgi:hypothetical protein